MWKTMAWGGPEFEKTKPISDARRDGEQGKRAKVQRKKEILKGIPHGWRFLPYFEKTKPICEGQKSECRSQETECKRNKAKGEG